jgi:hypothetical protein
MPARRQFVRDHAGHRCHAEREALHALRFVMQHELREQKVHGAGRRARQLSHEIDADLGLLLSAQDVGECDDRAVFAYDCDGPAQNIVVAERA